MDENDTADGAAAGTLRWIGIAVVGALAGAAIAWVAKTPDTVQTEVVRALSDAEITEICGDAVEMASGQLEEAQGKVQFLENEVVARSAQVAELENEMAARSERGRELVAELQRAKADLSEALEQLEIAKAEKEALVAELTETKEKLVETEDALVAQKADTTRAKEDALVNKWYRFVHSAQLSVCEKGTRKKMEACREVVQASLVTDERRDRFAHCVRSGQAVPMVQEIDKNEAMPTFAQMVNDAEKSTKDWLVVFCDPTLPENTDGFLNEEPLPETSKG